MNLRRFVIMGAFLLGLVVLDQVLGAGLNLLFPRVRTGQSVGSVNQFLSKKNVDLIIFGSSRAQHHFDPRVLGAELGLEAFNAGVDGQGVAYARAVEALLLQRGNTVRLFVLNVDIPDMVREDVSRAITLAPFWGENGDVDEILTRSTSSPSLKFLSSSFRFNSRALPLVMNLVLAREANLMDGFSPIDRVMQNSEEISIEGDWFRKGAEEMDPFKVSLYRDFLHSAREAGVLVVVAVGPRFWPGEFQQDPRADSIAHLAAVALEEGASFFAVDGYANPVFSDPTKFADPAHLNSEGARLYSELLAGEIAEVLESR